MAVIKCKMCGGNLNIEEGMTVAECEYCGTKQTIPRIDSDKKANLYDRANHFRRNNDFDKAMGIYESILNEDNTDAEAYWSLVLCRYGIEYVEDPTTHKRVPTVNRAQYTSIFDDEDYKEALKNADTLQRNIYEAEAKTINDIQKGILEISSKEDPFDCFISFKETDANGRRTRDAVLAQDLYNELTKEGFKVFFAPVTLEDKLGTAYEPYIFAALNSSKVMVVLGTKPEHFNAVWVKNEWSRYLSLIKGGAKKTLIPAYRDMDPYDLPEEFSHLMAQDMSKLGFMQDLIRGIKKLIGTEETKQAAKEAPTQSNASSDTAPLLKRAFMFIEDEDWISAANYCEKVLDINPECAEAYWGKFLAINNFKDAQSVVNAQLSQIKVDGEYTEACEEARDRIESAVKSSYIEKYLSEDEIRKLYEIPRSYLETAPAVKAACESLSAAFKADKLLEKAIKFASGEFKGVIDGLFSIHEESSEKVVSEAATEDKRRKDAAIKNYNEALDAADKKAAELNAAANKRREADYNKAIELMDKKEFLQAAEMLKGLGDYKDSKEKLERAALGCENWEKAKKKRIKVAGIVIAGLIAVFAVLYFAVIRPNQIAAAEQARIEELQQLVASGNVDELLVQLDAMSDDEFKLVIDSLTEEGKESDAVSIYIAKGDLGSAYAIAGKLQTNGKTAEAAIAYGKLGDYKDARTKSFALWNDVAVRETFSASYFHTVGLKSDGTVVATEYKGKDYNGQCEVSDWTDIIAISAGYYHTVGLKSDGTVVAVGGNDGQWDVSKWTDIVAISAGGAHTVGLKSDGTVVAVGNNGDGRCDVSEWTDIVAISAGNSHTVGLKSDGTVVTTEVADYTEVNLGQREMSDWTDIIAISAGYLRTVGLKSDGTVVAVGYNGKDDDGRCDVSEWTNIIAISAGGYHAVGLKSDGTVVAVGRNDDSQCDVSEWTDIVAISAGMHHTVGLKSDGTVVAVGYNGCGQCDVSDWTDIKLPNK